VIRQRYRRHLFCPHFALRLFRVQRNALREKTTIVAFIYMTPSLNCCFNELKIPENIYLSSLNLYVNKMKITENIYLSSLNLCSNKLKITEERDVCFI
jgi:hypothetical protein